MAAALLLLGASGLRGGPLLPAPAPLVPSRAAGAVVRAPAPVATAKLGLFEEFKERMTQLTDLRVARASHILIRKRSTEYSDDDSMLQLSKWKQARAPRMDARPSR